MLHYSYLFNKLFAMKNVDLTSSGITKSLLLFSLPLMLANLLQTFYNLADSMIVGNFIGAEALAAVGSSYSLMTFLTSIMIGLSLGSAASFSYNYGAGHLRRLEKCLATSFFLIMTITILIMVIVFLLLDWILASLNVPLNVQPAMKDYLGIIFLGLPAVFLYNYHASALRSIGNSVSPLFFMALSCLLNIGLDLFFILRLSLGVSGAAWATVISQYFSAVALLLCSRSYPVLKIRLKNVSFEKDVLKELMGLSLFTAAQQSVMNFGILMVQGLVNSFGSDVMAAFSAAVKIDGIAYLPMQDYGNGLSVFISQNRGAGKPDRVKKGIRISFIAVTAFGAVLSIFTVAMSRFLMGLFVSSPSIRIIYIGCRYLLIEGSFYILIGYLFLFYGYFRASGKPHISLILTIISLGTRVVLAYQLSRLSFLGEIGIWMSIPIGWALADLAAAFFLFFPSKKGHVH